MRSAWFKRVGWFHLPMPGGILTVAMLAFCAQTFFAVDRHSHSVSDMFCGVFPYFSCAFLLFDWIAGRTSDKS